MLSAGKHWRNHLNGEAIQRIDEESPPIVCIVLH